MQVFLVNGNPRAGKDTLVHMLSDVLRYTSFEHSYIDPVKACLDSLGIDYSEKTEADRRLLAEMGESLERHSNYLSRFCADFALQRNRPESVVFLYVRSAGPSKLIEALLHEADPTIVTRRVVLMRPEAGALTSNPADAGINHLGYDIEIHNDSSLDNLETLAELVADLIRKNSLPTRPANSAPRRTLLALRASDSERLDFQQEAA